ncbi:hypothetical protein [Psychromicrobium sp. YIM B11713]|uniref:hypothetical protein n=1 Tax=Psychromicrobium sp. YIM B11713 TaxID=3145233 RepID=UPI00374E7943
MNPLSQAHQFDSVTRRSTPLSAVPESGRFKNLSGVPAEERASGETIRELRSKIGQAQLSRAEGGRLESRNVETYPALRPVLPGGALRAGSSYTVHRSNAIAMALLAGPSAAGGWCGVVGVPEFNVEAAAQFGIDVNRLVLIPSPGEHWLGVSAALIDVVSALLLNPPAQPSTGQTARLGARLRQRGAVLICQTPWPQAEAELSAAATHWQGLGEGHGQLNGQHITVAATWRRRGASPQRHTQLQIPGSWPATAQRLPQIGSTRPATEHAARAVAMSS